MSRIEMSHISCMNESWHTYECIFVSSMCRRYAPVFIWMSHVTHRNESRRIYAWVMAHISTHLCDMTHSYVCLCVTWLIHMWLIELTYQRIFVSICVTWLIHMILTHTEMSHEQYINASLLAYVWHDSFIWSWHTQRWVTNSISTHLC